MSIDTNATPLEIYRAWNSCLLAGDLDGATELVDLDAWKENCLGLTGWLADFQVSVSHYIKNIVTPWDDLETYEEEVVEGQDAVTVRFRFEGTHVGEFLGIPATGRRISFDAIRIVKVEDGRVTGQWAQLDLWGIHQQLTAP
jgi:predicted ester cyclase